VEETKVHYEFNPYTFARISAMKSLLLKKEDYDRLLKMDNSEIVKFLQEGVYRDEINTLSIKYSGIKLVENALSSHLCKIFLKLKRISDPGIEYLMDQYLKRYDYWNLKTILRIKLTGAKEDGINDLFLPVGSLNLSDLKKLLKKEGIREILSASGIVDIKEFKEAIEKYEQTKDLSLIENLLDYHYFKDSSFFADKIPEQGKLFKEFFTHEFDIYNLKIILKKIFFNLNKKYAAQFIIKGGKEISEKKLAELLSCTNFSTFAKGVSRTPYGKQFSDLKEGSEDLLLKCEIALDQFLLRKSVLLFHQHPLSVDVVLGYMFAKEVEIKNLRAIIKSKQFSFSNDYIKKVIIVHNVR
jgi:V/A-type H+-transporting ATPase subunit C